MNRREVRIAIGACLVGVVASGAVAEAKTHYLITKSSQVKPGALAAGNLSAAAQKSLRGKTGQQGVQGIQGIQGVQGIQGPKGDPGTSAGGGAPSGAAGGSLAGTYPNPTIAAGAVGAAQVSSLPIAKVAVAQSTFALSPGSLTAGACSVLTETAPTGAIGDEVIISPPTGYTDAKLIVTGVSTISDGNHNFDLVLCNMGVTVNPGTGTFHYIVVA